MTTDLGPERDLLARCVAKQPGAWSDFVDRYVGLVYHVIQHTAHHRDVSLSDGQKRELCEGVFAHLLTGDMALLRGFGWRSHFVTWLAVTARRQIVHRLIERSAADKLGHVVADPDASRETEAGRRG